MEIASVGASGAYANNALQSSRPQASEAQSASPSERQRGEESSAIVEQSPQPVVNAEGQQTGTRVNVTA